MNLCSFCIAKEEFLSLAEKLKPFAAERMKIEPFPWFEGYRINIDELYTELVLEKIERKLLGEETWTLQTYKDMFNCDESQCEFIKVLIKAGPDMGKTTLGKKVTRDWATGVFKKFSIVFFVALKFVKPGDPTEKVIAQQYPELEGLHITQQKLRALLNRYGNRILIILDGLDEHGLGQNDDVLKIIKNQKLLDCGIVLSSRPHSVNEVQQHFPTIVRVEGFTEKEASKFVSKFFADQNRIAQILQFKPSDSRENFPVHKCPILLSFLCLLASEDEIDLSDRNLAIGDLYLRMVQCLYKKFTIRKGVPFENSEFVQVLKTVGQLALRTLKANSPLLQRSEVLRIVGSSAFEYGFFAGHQDFKICTDPTADIYVAYAHRSIEEFFGSFGFLQALNDGKSVEDIMGFDCEKPIFMVHPLVMKFCLWFLSYEEFCSSRRIIFDNLVAYTIRRIDFYMLNTRHVESFYPSISIVKAISDNDSLKLEFFKHVFEQCKHVQVLNVKCNNSREVEGVLGLIRNSLLNKLTMLSISETSFPPIPPGVNSNTFTILFHFYHREFYLQTSKILVTNHDVLERNPQVFITSKHEYFHDLSTLIKTHTKYLRLWDESNPKLSTSCKFSFCPQFTHFVVQGYNIDDSVPSAFNKAVKEGKFPNLRRIELYRCILNDRCEWPDVPEFSLNINSSSNIPQMQKLILKLTVLIFFPRPWGTLDINRLIPARAEKLSILRLGITHIHNLQCLNNLLKQGYLPNLSELRITDETRTYRNILNSFLEDFDPNHAVKLEKLSLPSFTISVEELNVLSDKLTSIHLSELDMTDSREITGSLSALFTHSFPALNTLILSHCRLNSQDIQGLARANVECKLPLLRDLNISGYEQKFEISDLFEHSSQWNQLNTLDTSDCDVLNVKSGFLTSLEELNLEFLPEKDLLLPVTRCWLGLKVIRLNNHKGRIAALHC